MQDITQTIIQNEGEGAILRKVSSFYDPGRSFSLFKVKVLFS